MSEQSLMSGVVLGVASSPVVRAIGQLVPGGGSLDVLIQERAKEIEKERVNVLLNMLRKGGMALDSDEVTSCEVLHAFNKTLNVVLGVYKREKVELIAKLFLASYEKDRFEDVDLYEENLSILSELSVREVRLLGALESYERIYPRTDGVNELQRARQYWSSFVGDAENIMALSPANLLSALTRLQRTGLYMEIVGNYWGYEGGLGLLTERYYELRKFVDMNFNCTI